MASVVPRGFCSSRFVLQAEEKVHAVNRGGVRNPYRDIDLRNVLAAGPPNRLELVVEFHG